MKMLVRLFSTVVFALVVVQADKTDVRFARDYFEKRGIQQIAAFVCWDWYEKVEVFRTIALPYTRLFLTPISDGLNMSKILKVNYYKLGVLLDLDCPKSDIILDQFIGERLPFNESYFWLLRIAHRNLLPLELLDRLPLSINAELTVAMRNGSRYYMYDVYNPSYRHGGKLNVTRMGYWDDTGGVTNELTQYKYKRRGDLRGMYLNFSIVAST